MNLKYKEANEYYHNYTWNKVCYENFIRKTKRWLSFDVAIIKKPREIKTRYDENGRVCTVCWKYKERENFWRLRNWFMKKDSKCYQCKNKKHKEYRIKTKWEIDKKYREKKRKLKIWEQISFWEIIYIDWLPREEIWVVKDKKPMQAYKLQSIYSGLWTNLDTVEGNTNYKKFYKIK